MADLICNAGVCIDPNNPDEGLPVPVRVRSILSKMARDNGLPPLKVVCVSPTLLRRYGGRYYPEHNAIAVVLASDVKLIEAVSVHEGSHAVLTHRGGHHGQHDMVFYEFLAVQYREFGVSLDTARRVEDGRQLPAQWRAAKTWESLRGSGKGRDRS